MFDFVTPEYISSVVLKKDSIRKSLPKNYSKIDRYILRIVQFYSGINSCMPITADYDLADFCKENGVTFRYAGTESAAIRKEIDNKILSWCVQTGNVKGAQRWLKALGAI